MAKAHRCTLFYGSQLRLAPMLSNRRRDTCSSVRHHNSLLLPQLASTVTVQQSL